MAVQAHPQTTPRVDGADRTVFHLRAPGRVRLLQPRASGRRADSPRLTHRNLVAMVRTRSNVNHHFPLRVSLPVPTFSRGTRLPPFTVSSDIEDIISVQFFIIN